MFICIFCLILKDKNKGKKGGIKNVFLFVCCLIWDFGVDDGMMFCLILWIFFCFCNVYFEIICGLFEDLVLLF